MAKYNRKNRAIVSGIFVGLASIYAIASHFKVEISELSSFMVTTVLFFLLIVGLAAVTVVAFKVLARLLRGKDTDTDDKPD
jgi:uncharacterized membrane protein YuzA (DUF378 family)